MNDMNLPSGVMSTPANPMGMAALSGNLTVNCIDKGAFCTPALHGRQNSPVRITPAVNAAAIQNNDFVGLFGNGADTAPVSTGGAAAALPGAMAGNVRDIRVRLDSRLYRLRSFATSF